MNYEYKMKMKYGSDWDAPLQSKANSPSLYPAGSPPAGVNSPANAKANRDHLYHSKIRKELTNRENEVLSAIEEIARPCTMHEVAKHLSRELHAVSGRFSELVKKGFLEITGTSTGNRSLYKISNNYNSQFGHGE